MKRRQVLAGIAATAIGGAVRGAVAGEIRVRSAVGVGYTFSFSLPVK